MWCGRIKAASLLVAYRCAQVVSFLPLEIRVERTESVLLADLSVIVFSHTTNYLHVDANLPAIAPTQFVLPQFVFHPPGPRAEDEGRAVAYAMIVQHAGQRD